MNLAEVWTIGLLKSVRSYVTQMLSIGMAAQRDDDYLLQHARFVQTEVKRSPHLFVRTQGDALAAQETCKKTVGPSVFAVRFPRCESIGQVPLYLGIL